MLTYKSLASLLALVGLLLATIFLAGCSDGVEELDYTTKVDRQKLLELKGKTVALLPIQYNDHAIVGQMTLDPSLVKVVLDHQKAALLAEFSKLFNVIDASEEIKIPEGSHLDPSNSELLRETMEKLNVDGSLIITTSCDYTFDLAGSRGTTYDIASDTHLIGKDGKVIWNFYGKAFSIPIPSELLAPDTLQEDLKWVFFIPPSQQIHVRTFSRVIRKYTSYLRWLMETDVLGMSAKNYYVDYPEKNKDNVYIYPALDDSHLPRIAKCIALGDQGMNLYHRSRHQEALAKFEDALDCCQQDKDQRCEWMVLNNIGAIHRHLGQYEEALAKFEDMLAYCQQDRDQRCEWMALNNIGLIYTDLGRYEEALDYYHQVLSIMQDLERLEPLQKAATTFWRRIIVLDAPDKYSLQKIGDREGESTSLANIGSIYAALGQYEEALDHFQQALSIAWEIEYRSGESTSLANIGSIYADLGQYEEALDHFQQALSIAQEIGDRVQESATLNSIGFIYLHLGQYEEALDYFEQALSIVQEIGYRIGESTKLNNIGFIYFRLGQNEEALDHFQQALSIAQEIGDRVGEGGSLNNIGLIYADLGQYGEALDYYQQGLSIMQEIGYHAGESRSLDNIGHIYSRLGQYGQALDYYQQAIIVIESMREEMTVDEIKSGFDAEQVYVYDHIISQLIEMERPVDAFDYVQRAKGRTFLDQLGNIRVSPTAGSDPALIQQEEQLRGEILTLDRALREEWARPQEQHSDEVSHSIATQLETKRADYARLLQTLKINNREYASLVTVDPLTLTDTQKILTNATMIEYFVTDSQTLAFVVTQHDFHTVQITVTRESLVESIQDFWDFDLDPSLEDVPSRMQNLYQYLIAPLEPHLKTDLLIIAPHNVLHYIPFGALHNGEHYLVEKFTLSYAPSASVLSFAFAKRKSPVAAPLVLGDPDGSLANSRQEAQTIAQLYGVTAHVGEDALERRVWEQGQEAGILHISTHGVYNDRNPLFSHVLLAADDNEDGHLDVYEIYNRGLNLAKADLVVLSACQTNVGELSRGDEIVGLSRALIYAGTPSVIASLWNVRDESTRVLMEKFYTHLREGISKAKALRQAQMEMIASDRYAHPYHWAAFGVMGDPGLDEIVLLRPTGEATLVLAKPGAAGPTVQTTSTSEPTLTNEITLHFDVPWGAIISMAMLIGGVFAFIVTRAIRAQSLAGTTGGEALIGAVAVARNDLDPEGTVFLIGEYWNAVAEEEDMIQAGSRVEIVGRDGFRLHVRRKSADLQKDVD